MGKVERFAANPEGHTLYRWTDEAGQTWACCAYDHGPFCRLCQRVDDDILEAMVSLVFEGELSVRTRSDGQLEFKATKHGTERARRILGGLDDAVSGDHGG